MALKGPNVNFGLVEDLPACAGQSACLSPAESLDILRSGKLASSLFVVNDCLKKSFRSVELLAILLKHPFKRHPVVLVLVDLRRMTASKAKKLRDYVV